MLRHKSLVGVAAVAVLLVLGTAHTALSSGGAGVSLAGASAAAPTAGCGRAPALSNGTHSIQSNGKNRTFILRIPDNYDNSRPYRLVFGFHWLNGTATDVATGQTVQRDVWAYYGLLRLSNNSTIFVAPQGLNNGWANSGGEDVTFVDDMIRRIEADLCVDTTQRFALGFSYGGGMSYALACARATVFRAVAVYAGGQISGCSGGTQPIAYFGAHGIRDNVLSIAGGRSLRDTFVRNNGCTAQNPPEPSQGSLTHRTTTYSGCRAGYPVVWAAFDEGHLPAPMDGSPGSGGSSWLPAETWRFFTQFQSDPAPTPTPTPSGTPTATPSGTPTPAPGGCSAVMTTVNSWPGGFGASVTVRAAGSAVNGWTVRWTWPGGQTISSLWNGEPSVSGSSVTVRNASYNGSIAAGGSTTFGFNGNGTAATPALTCTSP
ncbi:cellulose binding domain-containing protein [Sphaerisporangium sp. TRM90804]|uniref:cellulose binding domain-containing protein n=1 Tax=Sphaerisporangium sp. TRM90804 TaxID=3031113 RepID=UPI00244A0A2B|nr:cellulose binding domain-containing protein [Sphaerisporangium sp. TRM90804]MDH2430757.1 cellulose binding domain-containing protein [Sphaerisporangium sp. TRM90804]